MLVAALLIVCKQCGKTQMLASSLALFSSAVHQDKIGASNFFWSFPSEAAVKVHMALTIYETHHTCCDMGGLQMHSATFSNHMYHLT